MGPRGLLQNQIAHTQRREHIDAEKESRVRRCSGPEWGF